MGEKKEYAKYVGTSDVRVMLDRDWKAAGVQDQDTVVWDAATGFTVSRERFSDDAWAILALDPSIVFTGSRPDVAEIDAAAVNAAKSRLMVRQGGNPVLHAQDEVPAVGTSSTTSATRVQGSKATSKG